MSRRRRSNRYRGLRGDPEGEDGGGEGEEKRVELRARFSRATSEEAIAPQDDTYKKRAARFASLKPPGMDNEERSPSPYGRQRPSGSDAWPTSPWNVGGGAARPGTGTEEDRAFGTSAGTGMRLARQIRDEFLVCKICLETYTCPKTLECLHTFCEQCIESHMDAEPSYRKYSEYREVICPLCRKRTALPPGGVRKLPDSWLMSSLNAVVGRQRLTSSYPVCDVCYAVNRKQREATSKCVDCAKLLCTGCVLVHRDTAVTSGHSVFDIDIEKDIECKEHKDEVVRFYCEPCDACICVLCTFVSHKDHDICPFSEAVVKYKDSIRSMLTRCDDKMKSLDDQIEALGRCEDLMRSVEQGIHDAAILFVQNIRSREKELIEQVRAIFGEDCIDSFERRKDLRHMRETLQSTCSLTNLVLSGQDVELLLLKKDVQDKLKALTDDSSNILPTTVNKKIEFVIGSAELGTIRDLGVLSTSSSEQQVSNSSSKTTDSVKTNSSVSSSEVKVGVEKPRLHSFASSDGSISSSSGEGSSLREPSRAEMVDHEVQTDPTLHNQSSIQSNRTVQMEDKAVNTQSSEPLPPVPIIRGRGGITITSGVKRSSTTTVVKQQSFDVVSGTTLGQAIPEAGNVGERRQRMSRAHSAYSVAGTGVDSGASNAPQDAGFFSMANMTLEERRRWRMAAMNQSHQAQVADDASDVFYDAASDEANT